MELYPGDIKFTTFLSLSNFQSKVDAPTGMQKRKHQLHYLAHQVHVYLRLYMAPLCHLVNDGNRICCTTQESVYIHHGHTLMIIAVCKSVFHTASKQIFEPGKAWARGYIRYSPTSSFLHLSSAYFYYYLLILSFNSLIRVITSDCCMCDLCCSLQARARELELRNHWAQAAATRRQTQMKYGF